MLNLLLKILPLNLQENPKKLLQSKMVNQEIFHNHVTQLKKIPDVYEVEVQFLF